MPIVRWKRVGSVSALKEILEAYMECAEWSSTHTPDPANDIHNVVEMDSVENDGWSEKALAESSKDIMAFIALCAKDLGDMDPAQIGHDFWLTRNGHGAGFWDRGLGERGQRLTKASKVFGSVNLILGDDKKLHIE